MSFTRRAHCRKSRSCNRAPWPLLGIPGDATYANMAEANKALWHQTIVPLVRRVADELSFWLAPAFGGVTIEADLDGDVTSKWARVGGAGFPQRRGEAGAAGVGN
jgi:hypothetical protein